MNKLPQKRCIKCKKLKNKIEFGKYRRSKDGLYSLCKKCHNDEANEYRITNHKKVLEKLREYNHKRYDADPKKYHEWRRIHPEKVREYNHRYYQANKERFATATQNRQTRCKGGKVTLKQWEELKQKYNYTCLQCKRHEPEIKLTRDHVLPLELGGKHTIENLQPLCRSCNSKKGTKHIDYR